jgi:acyl carrier protein
MENTMIREVEEQLPIATEIVEQKVRQVVAKSLELELDEVHLTDSFERDLGAQSLDMLDIAFTLEREFRIQFPQTDVLQRAAAHFGEDALVQDGIVTDFGLNLIRKSMPEVDPSALPSGAAAADIVKLITVATFVRVVMRLVEVKGDFPRACPACGAQTEESDVMPEFVCSNCGDIRPLPTGDEVMLQDLVSLAEPV